jgi:hypothetical protein
MRRGLGAAAILVLTACLSPALAQQPMDEVLGGFDEEEPSPLLPTDPLEGFDDETLPPAPEAAAREQDSPPSGFAAGGSVSQDVSYNFAHDAPAAGATDHRGLSGLRSRLDAEFDLTFSPDWRAHVAGYGFYDWAWRIQGRDGYTEQFLDEYESDAALGEAWLQGRLGAGADIKAGRQIVVWGKSDAIRVTDVLNPLDVRLPGRTDIEDLRLPVTMTRLDFYAGDWNLSTIAVHETRFNRMPAFGSDFYTAPALLPPDDEPGEGFGDQEYALALNGIFSGWDLSLYGAWIYDDQPHLEDTPDGPRLRHSRLGMGGIAANVALGSWLFKGEAAYLDGIEFYQVPDEKFARLDALVGVEYSGFADTTISLEAANRHLFGFDSRLEGAPDDARRNDFETAIRFSQRYLNDTLELMFLASTHGLSGENGGFQRLQVTYDWTDSVEITAGITNYMSGDKLRFQGIADNDRLFAKVEYRF